MKKELLDDYLAWLSLDLNTLNKKREDSNVFITPFLDPINDRNQVKVTFTDDQRIRISDDANTYNNIYQDFMINLERSPIKINIFNSLLEMYLITLEGKELVKYCNQQDFSWALHYFSIGIIAIQNAFAYMKPQVSTSLSNICKSTETNLANHIEYDFFKNRISFHKDIKKEGKSGFLHRYDFSFGPNSQKPNIVMKAPNLLRPDNTQLMLFEWEDYLGTFYNGGPLFYIVADDLAQSVDHKIIKLIKRIPNAVYCPISEKPEWMEECRKLA